MEPEAIPIRALQAGTGKNIYFVILNEAKNLSFFYLLVLTIEEGFFASLRMTECRVFLQPARIQILSKVISSCPA